MATQEIAKTGPAQSLSSVAANPDYSRPLAVVATLFLAIFSNEAGPHSPLAQTRGDSADYPSLQAIA